MSGRLASKGYVVIDNDAKARVEARLPDGHSILVQETDAWHLLYLHGPNGGRVYSGPLRVSRGMALEHALEFALDRWFPDVVVTTDAAGWVKSIEDVA